MRQISIEQLSPGDICAVDVKTNKDVLVIRGGAILNAESIKRLRSFGFLSIYIDDEISKGIETDFALTKETTQNILAALNKMDIDNLLNLSTTMVQELGTNLFENDMKMLRSYDSYTEQHSLNVATYATVLAKAIGLTTKTAEMVAQAGLLHDIGKLYIPANIIQKPGKLTPEEYEVIKTHSEAGYQMLLKRSDIWSVVRVGVREHHENEDGSGYPVGLRGDKIHLIGKLLHIADVFDALTTKRSYKEEWSNGDALKFLTDKAGIMFDPTYATVFQKCVPTYHKGTIVELSNGETAIVVRNYPADPERPIVRTLSGEMIDLLTDGNYEYLYIKEKLKT